MFSTSSTLRRSIGASRSFMSRTPPWPPGRGPGQSPRRVHVRARRSPRGRARAPAPRRVGGARRLGSRAEPVLLGEPLEVAPVEELHAHVRVALAELADLAVLPRDERLLHRRQLE